jgi:hypothetical protein
MSKLIYSGIMSLDGYVADEDGTFDWSAPDPEVHKFVNDLERPISAPAIATVAITPGWNGSVRRSTGSRSRRPLPNQGVGFCRNAIKEPIDEPMGADPVLGITIPRLLKEGIWVEFEVREILGAAGGKPAGQDCWCHLGVELHGEVATQHESLGRLRVAGDLRGCSRQLPAVVVPLEPKPRTDQGLIVGDDLCPSQLRRRGLRHRAPVRQGEHLAAEADAEHWHTTLVGAAEQVELGQHPGADPCVVVRGPRGAHGDDDIEVGGLRKLGLDVGSAEPVGLDDLVLDEVVAPIDQALTDRAG